jgi:hypothetical protein
MGALKIIITQKNEDFLHGQNWASKPLNALVLCDKRIRAA